MKKVTRKVKQALSILLVAAMVITMVPQNTLAVSAEEAVETVTETETVETTVTDETEETKSDAGTVDETGDTAEDEEADAEETEEEEADVETEETDTEETADEETEAAEDQESEEGIKKGALDAEVMATEDPHKVTIANDESDKATVDFTAGYTEGNAKEGTDLTFTVTPAEGYKVTKVEYAVGAGEARTITDTEGVYTIPGAEITDDVTITVTTAALYDVTFNVQAGATVKVNEKSITSETAENEKKVTVTDGESVSFTVAVEDTHELVSVTADNGAVSKSGEDSITYTYTPIQAATITVATKEKTQAKQEVSFVYDEGKLDVKQVVTENEVERLDDISGKKLEVAEGEKLVFAVAAVKDSKYKPMDAVITPTDSEEEVPSTTATKKFGEVDYTVYTVTAVNEALTVKIDNELDPDKANVLTLAVDGNAGKVTVLVDGKKITAGEKALTAEGSCKVNVTADTGYAVTEVELIDKDNKSTPVELKDGKGTVEFGNNRELTLKVTLGGAASISENTIFTFNNKADHMTYSVPEQKGVTKKAGTTNLYQVTKEATEVVFNVTATGKFTPVVTINGDIQQGTVKESTKNGKKYEYKVSAAVFDDVEGDDKYGTIVIDEKAEQKTLTVKFNPYEVEVSAALSGREYKPVDGDAFDEIKIKVEEYEVDADSSLVLTVTPFTNCKITGATTQTGTAATKNVSVKETGAALTVKVTDNTVVEVKSEGLYKTALVSTKGEDRQPLEATKGIYAVDYDGTYITGVIKGTSTAVTLSKVTVMDGKKAAATNAVIYERTHEFAALDIDAKDAGKTLTVTLYTTVDDQDKAVGTYKMKVSTALTGVKITGIKNNALSQVVDTTAEYAITATTKTADLSRLYAESSDEDLVKAEVDAGKLVITTKIPTGSTKSATVKLYEGDEEAKKQIGNDITVNIADPAWKKANPTVKVKSTDDTSVTLTLTAPKNVITPNTGKLYYKVVVTPKTGKGAPEDGDDIVTKYIEKAEGASQDATITVNTADSGSGAKWKYDVTATLLQTNNKEGVDSEETNVIYRSKAPKAVTAETKTPAYETKLTLKKGTTTLYRGQKDVKVATVQFSKNTTHTNLQSIKPIKGYVLREGERYREDIATLKYKDGSIYADVVNEDIEPGKYSTTVYAEAPSGALSASAKLEITIASGISSIDVEVPSTSIYKADKKAATLKVTPVFNSASEFSTKAKKVNYEILDKDGNKLTENSRLYGMVTVKNGTVTVNKNYVVATDADENIFCVGVTAADYEGNPAKGTSAPITITSEAQKLGEVCIVKWNNSNFKFDVITRGNKTLTKEELEGARVVALKKGTEEKSAYDWNDFVDPFSICLTFKSSNKAVTADEYGNIRVNGTAKNVKLTVSTNDGGKQSAVLSGLTIGNTEVERLGIRANQYTSTGSHVIYLNNSEANQLEGDESFIANDEIHFCGTADSVIELKIDAVDDDRHLVSYGCSGLINYKVNIDKGGKLLSSSNGYAYVALSKESAVVTLEYKVGKDTKKDKFTIINDTFSDKKAPTVKVSGGILSVRLRDQHVTYSLSGDYDFAGKCVMVEVDPSITYGKTPWVAEQIADACDGINNPVAVDVDANGNASFTLTFKADEFYGDPHFITPGSYKLQLTFGTNEAGFVPDTKAVTTTLKVTKSKVNGSYKPVTKVTLSPMDQPAVELKGTGKNIQYEDYDKLCNVMNTNGQPNEFTKYFELEYGYLKIKDGVDLTDIKKEDLTGYVSYVAVYGEETYTDWTEGTVKITVTLKDTFVNKYSLSANTITVDENDKAVVEFKANGKPFDVAFVGSDIKTNGLNICEEDITDNKLTYTLCDTKKGDYKVDLYMVPASSYYCDELGGINLTTEEWLEATKKYGTKFTITIKVKNDIASHEEETSTNAAEADKAKAAAEAISVSNGDSTDKQKEILQAAQAAVANGFTVSVKEGTSLSITPATINSAGSATLTLVVSGQKDAEPVEVTCNWTIAALDQTKEEAKTAAENAITNLEVTNDTTKEQVLEAVTAVIKTSKYTAEWDSNNDFNKQEASVDSAGSIGGKILIKRVGSEMPVATITVEKEIPALQNN